MDYRETSYWLRQLFPGPVRVAPMRAERPKSRRGRAGTAMTVRVAEFSLYDGDDVEAPAPGEEAPRPESAACTVDFGRVDHALRTPQGGDVRVEMFLVGYPDSAGPVTDAAETEGLQWGAGGSDLSDPESRRDELSGAVPRMVAGAVAVIADDVGSIVPTPGTMLTDAARIGLGEAFGTSWVTTPHLLCVVPYVWPDGVPNIVEQRGQLSLHGGEGDEAPAADFPDADTGGPRTTTITQLIPVTDGEYRYAEAHGIDALMALLADAGPDLRDFGRPCVAESAAGAGSGADGAGGTDAD